jgi:hypothetical protein
MQTSAPAMRRRRRCAGVNSGNCGSTSVGCGCAKTGASQPACCQSRSRRRCVADSSSVAATSIASLLRSVKIRQRPLRAMVWRDASHVGVLRSSAPSQWGLALAPRLPV